MTKGIAFFFAGLLVLLLWFDYQVKHHKDYQPTVTQETE